MKIKAKYKFWNGVRCYTKFELCIEKVIQLITKKVKKKNVSASKIIMISDILRRKVYRTDGKRQVS